MDISPRLPPEVGIGLKPQHYAEVLESVSASSHSAASNALSRPGWLEVHPQNYYCQGGPPHRWLGAIAEHFPLSFHSVGLSLGSAAGCDRQDLEQLAALCERYAPASVSDHLSWSGSAHNRYPDLLPLPYTREALDHFVEQVSIVQDRLRRRILIENPARYLAYAGYEMDEIDFVHSLCARAGCGILFDISNIEVATTNLGLDPITMIDRIDPALVGEIHLAGHAREDYADGPLLIDNHGSQVSDLSWALFRRFISRSGPKHVVIEWDTDIPAYEVLIAEAATAARVLREQQRVAEPPRRSMLSLEQTQQVMMQALHHGPDGVPDGLFASAQMAGIRGLKVHANTISHGRLVALEETFPRTLERIGHARFNEHSRRFLDWPGVSAHPLALIGELFASYLASTDDAAAMTGLAGFEWTWLASYHSGEAVALQLGDLAGLDEASLLDVVVTRHPAARMLALDAEIVRAVGAEVPGLEAAPAILLARPDAEVLVAPASRPMVAIFDILTGPIALCNLFAACDEPECKDGPEPGDTLDALISLIRAGALVREG